MSDKYCKVFIWKSVCNGYCRYRKCQRHESDTSVWRAIVNTPKMPCHSAAHFRQRNRTSFCFAGFFLRGFGKPTEALEANEFFLAPTRFCRIRKICVLTHFFRMRHIFVRWLSAFFSNPFVLRTKSVREFVQKMQCFRPKDTIFLPERYSVSGAKDAIFWTERWHLLNPLPVPFVSVARAGQKKTKKISNFL